MRILINIIESGQTLPTTLQSLGKELSGKSWEAAKRIVVSKTGSVKRGERFDDDLADAIFLRIQANSQRGQYDREDDIGKLGRNARRLSGDHLITLYRAAPKGAGIRAGDFCSSSKEEAGYYLHGGHAIHIRKVPAHDIIALDGNLGDGDEMIYLPLDYSPVTPIEYYQTFHDFYIASQSDM